MAKKKKLKTNLVNNAVLRFGTFFFDLFRVSIFVFRIFLAQKTLK